jgi:hypothetical protein
MPGFWTAIDGAPVHISGDPRMSEQTLAALTEMMHAAVRQFGGVMTETEAPAFSGSIVLKAKTRAEVAALAAQLDWYAAFDDPFANRYEGGYAAKGQVRTVPLDSAADPLALQTQIRDQAVRIGQLEEQLAEMTRERARAEREAAHHKKWHDLLTREEHWRLVGRNVGEQGLIVVEPALGDEVIQQLAREVLEIASVAIETEAPDSAHCNQRAADVCATLVRALKSAPVAATPEDLARQAERMAAFAERFRELFGGRAP